MESPRLTFSINATIVFLWKLLLHVAVLFLLSLAYVFWAPQLALELIPYLLLIFLVLRLVQFISQSGYTYKNVTQFKHLIRICLFIALFTVQSGISLNLVSNQPHQNWFPFDLHKLALHQSKKNFILLRYVFSFLVYFIIHHFGNKQAYNGSNLHALQALTEIIDCIIIFWEDDVFSLYQDYYDYYFHHLVQKKPIEIKYILAALLKHSGSMKIFGGVLVYYDLFILCSEVVVCYVLRNVFKRSSRKLMVEAPLIDKLLYRKQIVYFVNGTKNTIGFFFSLLMVYNVCSNCVESFFSYKFKQTSKEFGEIGKRYEKLKEIEDSTYNIMFLFSILWIIKTIFLLAWESHTIYDRLRSRILSISEQLYFLCILDCRNHNFLIEDDQTKHKGKNKEDESLIGWIKQFILKAIGVNVVVDNIKRNKIRDELLWKKHCDPTLDDLQQMAQHILVAQEYLSNDYFSAISNRVTQNSNDRDMDINQTLQQQITWGNEYEEDGQHFRRLLNMERSVSLKEFMTWVEKTHDKVITLANTLTSAKQVSEGLNKVVSVVLIGAAVVAWLKVLKFAEISKDFALIASPFFAAAFFIKDPMKDFLERIFFVYVIHPFDIGDLCLIDDIEMEVAAMGLWTTTFLATGEDGNRKRQKTVIYSNSKLANIRIIKHATEFDWGDFSLKSEA